MSRKTKIRMMCLCFEFAKTLAAAFATVKRSGLNCNHLLQYKLDKLKAWLPFTRSCMWNHIHIDLSTKTTYSRQHSFIGTYSEVLSTKTFKLILYL